MFKNSRAYAGQALVEYLWVIVVIALVCIPAIMFMNEAQENLFDANQEALNTPMLGVNLAAPTPVPTATESPYYVPMLENDCKKKGWKTFYTPDGTFKNQGDCVSWVRTKGKNAPALPNASALP